MQCLALISKWKVLWRFSQFSMNGVCLRLCKHYFLSPDGKNLHGFKHPKKKLKDGGMVRRGRHLIRSRCISIISAKVCILVSAYASVMQSLHRRIPVFCHAGKSFRCRSWYRLSDLWEWGGRKKQHLEQCPAHWFICPDRHFKPLAAYCLCKQEPQLRWKEAVWLTFWHSYF